MAKPLRDISPKGQFSGKRSTTEAPPSIDKDNFYNWEGGEDGVKFIKNKHQTSRRNYPYDDAAFTGGKVKEAPYKKQNAKVYESKRMKCESCGGMYEGEACGCGKPVADAKADGKRGMIADKKKLQEVLTKKTPASKVISDFVHSDDPKFAGKSKKERMKMALGAYYGMHPEKSKKKMEEMTYPAVPMLEDGKKKKGKTQKESAPADTPMNLNTTGASFGITGDGRV